MRTDIFYKTYKRVRQYVQKAQTPISRTKIKTSLGLDINSVDIALGHLEEEGLIIRVDKGKIEWVKKT